MYPTRAALCEAAAAATVAVASQLRQSAFLYYMARYLVAVYEAQQLVLPIQVWNDYRNALDHFMRHITAASNGDFLHTNDHHLEKMEGHLQRAVLDVCKMLYVTKEEWVDRELAHWGDDVLDLMDGGHFRAQLITIKHEARALMEAAKVGDFSLGRDTATNVQIVERFLDAFYAMARLGEALESRQLALANAKRQLALKHENMTASLDQAKADLAPKAMRRAFWIGVAASVVVSLPLTIFGWWLGVTYGPSPPTVTAQGQEPPPPAQPTPAER
jgi:hypothetical protein